MSNYSLEEKKCTVCRKKTFYVDEYGKCPSCKNKELYSCSACGLSFIRDMTQHNYCDHSGFTFCESCVKIIDKLMSGLDPECGVYDGTYIEITYHIDNTGTEHYPSTDIDLICEYPLLKHITKNDIDKTNRIKDLTSYKMRYYMKPPETNYSKSQIIGNYKQLSYTIVDAYVFKKGGNSVI